MKNVLSEAIIRLREITPNLPIPSFQDVKEDNDDPDYVEMSMFSGVGYGFNLMFEENVAVAKWFSNAGAIFPMHEHGELEVITVYSGSMTLILHDRDTGDPKEEICLYPGVCYYTEPNTPHSAYFTEDTWYIALTVPASEAWPHG